MLNIKKRTDQTISIYEFNCENIKIIHILHSEFSTNQKIRIPQMLQNLKSFQNL